MGLIVRRRIRAGRNSWVNVSGRGASGSFRRGPLTVNTRGRYSIRLARGVSYRGGCAVVLVLVPTVIAGLVAGLARIGRG